MVRAGRRVIRNRKEKISLSYGMKRRQTAETPEELWKNSQIESISKCQFRELDTVNLSVTLFLCTRDADQIILI